MIIVTGSVVVREGELSKALELSQQHVARSRQEAGCLSHAVHIDAENPNRLVFFEEWQDEAALKAHFAVPASQAFVNSVAALATEAPMMTMYEAETLSAL